jgi:PST family polysaccharide transporter
VLRFPANILLARMLGPLTLGQFALAMSYSEILGILGSFSFAQALVQLDQRLEKLVDTVFWMTMAVTIVIFGLSAAIYPVLRHFQGPEVAKLFLALVAAKIITGASSTLEGVLQQRFHFGRLATLRLVTSGLGMVLALAAAWMGGGALALLVRDVSPMAMGIVVIWVGMKRSGVAISFSICRKTAREVWQLGRALFLVRGAEVAYHRADELIVGLVLGPTSLGFYSQARYLASLPNAALAPATAAVGLRTMSALREDVPRLQRAYCLLQYCLAIVMLPLGLVAFLGSDLIVRTMLGPGWMPTAHALKALSLWMIILPLFESEKTFLIATQKWWTISLTFVVQLSIVAVLAYPLSRWMGAPGIALLTAVSLLGGLVFMGSAIRRQVQVKKGIYRTTTLAGVAGVVAGMSVRWALAPRGLVFSSLLSVFAGLTCFTAILLAVDGRRVREEARYIGSRVRQPRRDSLIAG